MIIVVNIFLYLLGDNDREQGSREKITMKKCSNDNGTFISSTVITGNITS